MAELSWRAVRYHIDLEYLLASRRRRIEMLVRNIEEKKGYSATSMLLRE